MKQREIEFRFFRKSPSPKMIYPECDFLVNHLGTPMAIVRYPNKIEILEVDVIPLQYTGLKDKNDKKIYEGDIVNFHIFTQELGEGYGVMEGEREWIGHIVIEPFGIWLASDTEEKSGYINDWHGIHEESFEIIGNIYENPELLNPNT